MTNPMNNLPPGLVVEVKTYKSLVRIPLRLRFWRWWYLRRWRNDRDRKVMLMQEDFARELERRFLFGTPAPLAERLAPYSMRTSIQHLNQ